MRKLELLLRKRRSVDLLYLVEKSIGWAYVLLDDSTGLVSIHSDWGSAAFCWTSIGSQSLAEFFCDADPHYILTKFGYNNPELKGREADVAATRKAMFERWPEVDEREDILAFCEDLDNTNADIALARSTGNLHMFEVLELIVYRPTPIVELWLTQLIPALQKLIRLECRLDKEGSAGGS